VYDVIHIVRAMRVYFNGYRLEHYKVTFPIFVN